MKEKEDSLDVMGYMTNQFKSGLKEGDRVRITHKVESDLGGWHNSWVDPMDKEIGMEFTIEKLESKGVRLLGSIWLYPYFVLEKVKPCDFIKVELVTVKRKGRWIRP